MSQNNANNPHHAILDLGSQSASIQLPGLYVSHRSTLRLSSLIDRLGIPMSNVNYVRVQVLNGATLLAEIDTRVAPALALVGLQAPQTEVDVPAGSSLSANVIIGGAAVLTNAALSLELHKL